MRRSKNTRPLKIPLLDAPLGLNDEVRRLWFCVEKNGHARLAVLTRELAYVEPLDVTNFLAHLGGELEARGDVPNQEELSAFPNPRGELEIVTLSCE